jgi:hypothetical protein
MNPPFFEQESSGIGIEYRMCHQSAEVLHIGWELPLGLLCGFPFGKDDVVLVGQPSAGFEEGLAEDVHREVDGTSMGIAHKAFVHILSRIKGQGRVLVGMKRTERLVFLDLQPEPVGHSLDGEGTEFIEFVFFHKL